MNLTVNMEVVEQAEGTTEGTAEGICCCWEGLRLVWEFSTAAQSFPLWCRGMVGDNYLNIIGKKMLFTLFDVPYPPCRTISVKPETFGAMFQDLCGNFLIYHFVWLFLIFNGH